MALSAPQVIYERSPIKVGWSNSLGQTSWNNLWEVTYDGLLVSENHRRVNGKWLSGGPFYVKHRTVHHGGQPQYTYTAGNVTYVAKPCGDVRVQNVSVPVPSPWSVVRADTASYYATGYARARPGNPSASVGNFLLELRNKPTVIGGSLAKWAFKTISPSSFTSIPKLLKLNVGAAKQLGKEHLNVEFGWKPLISDLQKMYNLMFDIDRQMAQIVRDNGKNIRRRANILDEETTAQTKSEGSGLSWFNWCGAPTNHMQTGGCNPRYQSSLVTTTKTRVWWAGSFRYWIPDTSSWAWNAEARAMLFGALPTPSMLWEALPWTWLIDWFSNVGDVISNLSPNAVENLVTNYSYVMKEVIVTKEYTNTQQHGANTLGAPPAWSISPFAGTTFSIDRDITRTRVGGGNPYGLDVSASSLSARQWGILAALGISRAKVQ